MPVIPFYDPDTNGFVYHVEPDVHNFYSESVSEISSETESSDSGRTIATDDLPGKHISCNITVAHSRQGTPFGGSQQIIHEDSYCVTSSNLTFMAETALE
ncbi:hypothetical protein FRC12_020376 [Ceratobasidium sp. 428]|nr:hypothetical protein FRC12_020376 [Ceratobasidium sp. 428]